MPVKTTEITLAPHEYALLEIFKQLKYAQLEKLRIGAFKERVVSKESRKIEVRPAELSFIEYLRNSQDPPEFEKIQVQDGVPVSAERVVYLPTYLGAIGSVIQKVKFGMIV